MHSAVKKLASFRVIFRRWYCSNSGEKSLEYVQLCMCCTIPVQVLKLAVHKLIFLNSLPFTSFPICT